MAQRNRERWIEAVREIEDPKLHHFGQNVLDDPATSALMDTIFGNSPFLTLCMISEPCFFHELLTEGPTNRFGRLLRELEPLSDTTDMMRQLRIAKRRTALLTALADISDTWQLEEITAALSSLADRALSLAAAHLLRRAHDKGDIVLPYPDTPAQDSGLVVIGMGKLGAQELNYSSDIDIIIFYDHEKVEYRGRRSIQEMMVALARDLVKMMEERTSDGYVFRTDIRLRPDPGSTPAAISLLAAETYYEGFGQNWERAAMIKARQVAGDTRAGAGFLNFLRPFIWRKNLDFAAIQDIHSIKRQINAHKGGARIAVAGHNVKLGRGGIREIEFFAQTQQLIWGGREAALRIPRTCEAISALAEIGHIDPKAAGDLRDCYHFLRRVEHRLQMTDDKQTQTLPDEPDKLNSLAVFLGYPGAQEFGEALRAVLQTVEGYYAQLFENAPSLSSKGNLVFTGADNDQETLQTLSQMGFKDTDTVCRQIRGWHHGRVRPTRSTRARELLTELTPTLLEALSRTADPDEAFKRFDDFLSHLPAGIALFSLFYANPVLLDLVAEVMGDAPRLAEALSHNTTLLDAVLSPGFFDHPGSLEEQTAELNRTLEEKGDDFQTALDVSRRWVSEQKFRIGVQTLRGLLDSQQIARHLSNLAEATLLALQPRVEMEFARQHGRFPGMGAAIVAMGKLGSREMTARSDLDLILVYDDAVSAETSDGPKPLSPNLYYSRLTQRIINALTVKTPEGTLYEVDMRLRPSGNAGPIATSLTAFQQYHETAAWTWEHMALTRARVVTGSPALRDAIESITKQTLSRPRDPDQLLIDVAEMRDRIAREHKSDDLWEVKHLRGGLVDIEFIAQYLQLRWADRHPCLLQGATHAVLEEAAHLGLLSDADGEVLQDALRLWSAVQQVLRQTIADSFGEDDAPGRLKDILVSATGSTHFRGLRLHMAEQAAAVLSIYNRIIATPAEPLRAALAEQEKQ